MTTQILDTRALDTRASFIPLSKLSVHARNVRHTDKRVDIEALAASIEAHGLLQNLTVVAREGDRYAVTAGGRRLRALKLLAKQGRIARDYAAPCMLGAEEDALEASLAENVQRVAMNVMDEMEAFGVLVDAGASAEDVARRFGTTIRHVEQRLALAHLSPVIRAAYRKGDITLDVARAFCLASDHAIQEQVFKQLSKPITHAHTVRNALTQGRVSSRDRVALFVGLEAYEAAGGRVVRDLFEDGVVFLEDGDLLHRLANERLDAARAEALAAGWGWAEATPGRGGVDSCAAERLQPTMRKLTAAKKRQIAAARSELERLDNALENTSGVDDESPLWAERDAAEERLGALQEAAKDWDRQLMAHAGVALAIDHDGRLSVTRGLIKRTALKALNKLRHRENQVESGDENGLPEGQSSSGDFGEGMSKALIQTLTTARTGAIRSALKDRPQVALALLVHTLQQGCLRDPVPGVAISARAVSFDESDAAASDWSATGEGDVADAGSQWCALLSEPTDSLLAKLATLVSETVDLTHVGLGPRDRRVQAMGDAIAAAVDLDMAGVWAPDEAFWIRAPKALALSALESAPAIASLPLREKTAQLARFAKMKKAELAAVAAEQLSGTGWLPEILVTPLPEGALVMTEAGRAVVAEPHAA